MLLFKKHLYMYIGKWLTNATYKVHIVGNGNKRSCRVSYLIFTNNRPTKVRMIMGQ